MSIERALLSVYDKTGVVEFARTLAARHIELISTGGTAKLLRDAGLAVRDVADLTGWPEMMGGRVKTLHPMIHGGILFRREDADDTRQAEEHGIPRIDLVVVNLYPFSATARKTDVAPEELIENIDIGGPAMLRAAAKNFQNVAVITDPADYSAIAEEISAKGKIGIEERLRLARKAFALTARYDGEVAGEMERLTFEGGKSRLRAAQRLPERLYLSYERRQAMRYGENPHQAAALYMPAGAEPGGLAGARQLQGKELSYNNLVDLDAAWDLAREFHRPAAVIVKHSNPCGASAHHNLAEAYRRALACDPTSAFGGVMAFNQRVDAETASEVAKLFVECIVAPGYDEEARDLLAGKKNLRLLQIPMDDMAAAGAEDALELKRISGGLLVQEPDREMGQDADWKVVTEGTPSDAERSELAFAWKVCKHVKSNAIVFTRGGATLAIGAGQMSRVDSVRIAVMKARDSLKGSVVASDAFFPFPDGVEEAGKAGAVAVIQPGGSVRDKEVIAAADALGMAMVFTGIRHFRH